LFFVFAFCCFVLFWQKQQQNIVLCCFVVVFVKTKQNNKMQKQLLFMSTLLTFHFKELYFRIAYFLFSWFISLLIAYEFKENILLWITHRVFSEEIEIIYISLPEAIWNFLLISIWGGLLVTMPLIILNIYAYFRSGLYQYEASRWDVFIGTITLGWIPFHYWQISMIWPKIANWFLSYSEDYTNLSYLPTMNQFFSFLLNWSSITSFFFMFFLILLFRIILKKEESMKWYTNHREKYLLGFLFISGILTPPDLISQIFVAVGILSTIEIIVFLEALKMGWNFYRHKIS